MERGAIDSGGQRGWCWQRVRIHKQRVRIRPNLEVTCDSDFARLLPDSDGHSPGGIRQTPADSHGVLQSPPDSTLTRSMELALVTLPESGYQV